ncbi:MAG: histidine kinase [Lachnospiraceae bacterium]|nr:histidine kinase [Lachnospiraceae bacterium]
MKGKHRIQNKAKIKQQLYLVYFLAVFLPILIIGVFLLTNTYRLLSSYHRDLLRSDNLRVKTILFEITTQMYKLSEELVFDEEIANFASTHHYVWDFEVKRAEKVKSIDSYEETYAEIDSIEVYTDNPAFMDYKQFYHADKKLRASDWFQKAINQTSVFWMPMSRTDEYGNVYWNLCLIRKIPLVNSKHHAVLVIRISDNYLRTRIGSEEYPSMISVDQSPVFYSSDRRSYGFSQPVEIDYEEEYYQFSGDLNRNGEKHFVDVSTLHMYQSDSKVYICTINEQAYGNIQSIIYTCLAIIAVAIVLPGLVIHFFADYFTSRILTLRRAMHQVSNEDYEIVNSVKGNDEVSEAFLDLEIMVRNIKKKDAEMYEAHLNEKELVNQQEVMKFKMLSSQINPHFLYNTLETIRMKAFKAGDREVATAIKLLGKSMRYVLENTGTTVTTLNREIEHVETYLAIQELRFGNKFKSYFVIGEGIDVENIFVLPLMLQPIVENAILHGLEEKETDGKIVIAIYHSEETEQGEFLMIDISDNGFGMDAETLAKLRESIELHDESRSRSIGLYNINQRIKLSYGAEYGVEITSEPERGTMVRVKFPLERAVEE